MDPYASGVLDEDVHGQLVRDIDRIARDAGIAKSWIWTPAGKVLSEAEVSWLKKFRSDERCGLAYVGSDFEVETRMSAIAGALTRNFIRSRVMTANAVIDAMSEGDLPPLTCLLIPNFFADGGQPTWRVNLLYDLLLDRMAKGQKTVLGITSLKDMEASYGSPVRKFVQAHYQLVTE